jgi:hypothetical protein
VAAGPCLLRGGTSPEVRVVGEAVRCRRGGWAGAQAGGRASGTRGRAGVGGRAREQGPGAGEDGGRQVDVRPAVGQARGTARVAAGWARALVGQVRGWARAAAERARVGDGGGRSERPGGGGKRIDLRVQW